MLDPHALKLAPAGAEVILEVTTEGGIRARARLNPKSYRKALETIREHGPDNVAVILQGRMVKLVEDRRRRHFGHAETAEGGAVTGPNPDLDLGYQDWCNPLHGSLLDPLYLSLPQSAS